MARLLPAVALVGAVLVPAWASAGESSAARWDVRALGARGDGVADDTAAFQTALDECGKQGGIVHVPSGRYMIRGHLTVPASVTLEGEWRAPPTVDAYHDPADPQGNPLLRGSVLLAVEGAGDENGTPFIRLGTNATLKGLTIFYPEQTKTNPPVAYPWTVQSAGADNCSIVDCLLVNPYQAVDFGTVVAGRHHIRNLYAEPLRRGLYVDLCLDVGRIENIHFWPFWTAADSASPIGEFKMQQGEAFILGRADWEHLTNCFAISYHVGFRFIRGPGTGPFEGAGNYLITGGGADCCDTAVLVEETQGHSGVSFANSQIFGDLVVRETNGGPVRFTGCGLFGSLSGKQGTALAKLSGRGSVSFSNCHFYCIHPESRNAEATVVVEGGRVRIEGCEFINCQGTEGANSNPIPIVLQPDVRSAIIIGNEFWGQARIVNRARGRVVIEHNLEETEDDPFPERP